MKIVFLVIGKTTDAYSVAAIQEYTNRLRHYIPFENEVIPELKNARNLNFDQQKEREADLLLKSFQPGRLYCSAGRKRKRIYIGKLLPVSRT